MAVLRRLPDNPRRTIFTSVREAGSSRPAIVAFRDVLERTASLVASDSLATDEGPATDDSQAG
jgi:hypothetical protein